MEITETRQNTLIVSIYKKKPKQLTYNVRQIVFEKYVNILLTTDRSNLLKQTKCTKIVIYAPVKLVSDYLYCKAICHKISLDSKLP